MKRANKLSAPLLETSINPEMMYNISCLGERVTGRFAFSNAVTNHNLFIVGKAPLMCGLTSRCSPRQRRHAHKGRFIMLEPRALICLNCQTLYRGKNNRRSIFCEDCKQAGWKRCQRCKVLFISTDGRDLCSSHPERARRKIDPRRYTESEERVYKTRSRFIILKRDGFQCIYCGKSALVEGVRLHADHLIPASHKRGTDTADNLVTACAECNGAKHDMMLPDSDLIRIRTVIQARNRQHGIPDKLIIKDITGRDQRRKAVD